jgi:hypothetical protein
MATYKGIQNFVKENHDCTVKTCHIADVKEQCGLPVHPAWNRKSPDERQNPCPDDKIQPIREALRHFMMIE